MPATTGIIKTLEILTLNADSSATTDGVAMDVSFGGLVAVQITTASSWDGTINFEISMDTSNFSSILGTNRATGSSSINHTGTATTQFLFDVSGCAEFRTRVSGRTTGTVTCRCKSVPL